MKKLTTIRLAVVLLLSLTCVSWATLTVNAPPGAPSWWDTASTQYAYASWDSTTSSPPNDSTQWASNFLQNTNFTGGIYNVSPWINLSNGSQAGSYEIYIYISGESDNYPALNPTLESFNIGGSTFTGSQVASSSISPVDGEEYWSYVVSGGIVPLPASLYLEIGENAIMSASMWVGVSSVPEPATIGLLGLGALGLLRKRRK
jgi:hypothetical protein